MSQKSKRGRPRISLTQSQLDEAVKLYDLGLGYRNIAWVVGAKKDTIRRRLKELGRTKGAPGSWKLYA